MAADWRRSVFGERLVRPAPTTDFNNPLDLCSVDVLLQDESNIIAIYFRSLAENEDPTTQILTDLHKELNGRLEIVQVFIPPWVGFQQCNADLPQLFKQAYVGVPWYTMPIDDQVKWVRLKHRYRGKVGMLVLLSAQTGQVLLKDAGYQLKDDPQGLKFPWLPRSTSQIMGEATQKGLISGGLHKGPKIIPYSSLDGFIKALYFSAHWCPPCKAFTPQLIHCYHKVKSRGHKFEVIFISSDRHKDNQQALDSLVCQMNKNKQLYEDDHTYCELPPLVRWITTEAEDLSITCQQICDIEHIKK